MSALVMPLTGGRMMTSALPWPAKCDGRTNQPVRRNSVPEEMADDFYRKERAGHTGREILAAAKRLMTDSFAGRKKGARRGALTLPDYNILKFMIWDCWDKRNGKLDPSYSQIQEATGHAKATIARALDRLEALGFIERMRRLRKVKLDDGAVEVRQTNNAYRVSLPDGVRRMLKLPPPPPVPDDQVQRTVTAFIENDQHIADELRRPTLGSAVARLGALITKAESSS